MKEFILVAGRTFFAESLCLEVRCYPLSAIYDLSCKKFIDLLMNSYVQI